MLTNKLIAGYHVKQATEDADYLSVNTAMETSRQGGRIFIVGDVAY